MSKLILYCEGEFQKSTLISLVETVKNELFQDYDQFQLEQLINKWCRCAKIYTCTSHDKIIGLIVFYANDPSRCNAFITFVATDTEYRNHGIGGALLTKTKEFCRMAGFKFISLETYNNHLANWYIKHSFQLVSHTQRKEKKVIKDSYIMKCQL